MADQDITGRDQYFYTRLNKGMNNTFSRSSSDIADMCKVSLQYLIDPELVFVNASNSTFIKLDDFRCKYFWRHKRSMHRYRCVLDIY